MGRWLNPFSRKTLMPSDFYVFWWQKTLQLKGKVPGITTKVCAARSVVGAAVAAVVVVAEAMEMVIPSHLSMIPLNEWFVFFRGLSLIKCGLECGHLGVAAVWVCGCFVWVYMWENMVWCVSPYTNTCGWRAVFMFCPHCIQRMRVPTKFECYTVWFFSTDT